MVAMFADVDALVAERDQMRDALAYWDKFAMYAMGTNGHTPITLPLWHALLFEKAVEESVKAIGPTFGEPLR